MHKIHVYQDQVTHMHRLSEYQRQCQKRKRILKHYYMTECLKNVTKASTSCGKGRLRRQLTGGRLA
jgi:hypothetical protein